MAKQPHEYSGLGATLIALLVLAGVLAVIGVVVWLRKVPSGVPTRPAQAVKSTSELHNPISSRIIRRYMALTQA